MVDHKLKLTTRVCATLACVFLSTIPAHASFINGIFQFGSTSMRVTANDIIFFTIPALVPSVGAPNGNFQVLPPVSSSFVGRAGEIGTVNNLTRIAADSPP